MAVSDSAVKQRIDQILQERGNTPEAYAQIAREAREAGVSALQVDRALDNELTEADIRRAAAEAGGAFGITDLASRLQSGDLTREQAESLMQANIASPLSAEASNLKYNPPQGQLSLLLTHCLMLFRIALFRIQARLAQQLQQACSTLH